MIELPVYIGIAWILVGKFGIAGAAGAWTLRVALDALLLFAATFKLCGFSRRLMSENGSDRAVSGLVMLAGITYGLMAFSYLLPQPVQFLLVVGLLVSFVFFAWIYVLDNLDRVVVLKVLKLNRVFGSKS